MPHHHHPLEKCLARIFFADDARQNISCGTGVVLHGDRVLTCAHVVNAALKLRRDSTAKPQQILNLDFPLAESTQRVQAEVGFWDASADLAELKLITPLPPQVEPTALHIEDGLWKHRVQAFGFPTGYPEGTWADSILHGPNANGWIEIIGTKTTGYYVQQGFSGGPVWDENLQCCIGIVVAADKNVALRASCLIPARKIADVWKDLPSESVHHVATRSKATVKVSTLLSRVNRQAQENFLRDLLSRFDAQRPVPVVTVVHGDDQQAHDIFFQRLLDEVIPGLPIIDRTKPIRHYHVRWPTHVNKLTDLEGILTRSIGDYVSDKSNPTCLDIQQAIHKIRCPVVVDIHLNTEDWLRHKAGILETFHDYWQSWQNLPPGQTLFAFLFVTHTKAGNNPFSQLMYSLNKKRISAQLRSFARDRYDHLISILLPELSDVTKTETEDWARQHAFEYCDGDLSRIMPKIRDLYGNRKALPMEFLTDQLKGFLTTIVGNEER